MLSDEERLAGAELNLRHVGDTSVPVVLNIIGNYSVQNHLTPDHFQTVIPKQDDSFLTNVICSHLLLCRFLLYVFSVVPCAYLKASSLCLLQV